MFIASIYKLNEKEAFFHSQQILQFPLCRLTIKSLINLRTLIYPLFSLIIPSNSRYGGLDDPFLRFLYFRGYFCSSWQPWSSLSPCYKSWRSLKHVSGKKRKKEREETMENKRSGAINRITRNSRTNRHHVSNKSFFFVHIYLHRIDRILLQENAYFMSEKKFLSIFY